MPSNKSEWKFLRRWVMIGAFGLIGYGLGLLADKPEQPSRPPVAVIHGEQVEPPPGISLSPPAIVFKSPLVLVPRPVLDGCPPGIEISYRVLDERIVGVARDELESQIQAKMLCHVGNQLKLVDYIDLIHAQGGK